MDIKQTISAALLEMIQFYKTNYLPLMAKGNQSVRKLGTPNLYALVEEAFKRSSDYKWNKGFLPKLSDGIDRLRAAVEGFMIYWEESGKNLEDVPDAARGLGVSISGDTFFGAIEKELGDLHSLILENLKNAESLVSRIGQLQIISRNLYQKVSDSARTQGGASTGGERTPPNKNNFQYLFPEEIDLMVLAKKAVETYIANRSHTFAEWVGSLFSKKPYAEDLKLRRQCDKSLSDYKEYLSEKLVPEKDAADPAMTQYRISHELHKLMDQASELAKSGIHDRIPLPPHFLVMGRHAMSLMRLELKIYEAHRAGCEEVRPLLDDFFALKYRGIGILQKYFQGYFHHPGLEVSVLTDGLKSLGLDMQKLCRKIGHGKTVKVNLEEVMNYTEISKTLVS